jgi:Helix-turn-helix domain of transposase family ISL3
MPLVECAEHGVSQAATPWADSGSRFTALLAAVVIDWLKEASFAAVARRLGLSWDEVDGILPRAAGARLADEAQEDGARGANGQDPPQGDPERGGASDDERGGRVDERSNPGNQADGGRVKERRALPERDPLPSRGA